MYSLVDINLVCLFQKGDAGYFCFFIAHDWDLLWKRIHRWKEQNFKCCSLLSIILSGHTFKNTSGLFIDSDSFDSVLYQSNVRSKLSTLGILLAICIPVYLWYFKWLPFLNETYQGSAFFLGKSIQQGAGELISLIPEMFKRLFQTPGNLVGLVLIIAGLILCFRNKEKKILWFFLIATLSFLVVALNAGSVFTHHNYYIIPYVPVVSILIGYAFSSVNQYLRWGLIFALMIDVGLHYSSEFKVKTEMAAIQGLEESFNRLGEGSDLVLVNSPDYPTPVYFMHRKAWLCSNSELKDPLFIKDKEDLGATYILVLKKVFGSDIELPYPLVEDNENWRIYSLKGI